MRQDELLAIVVKCLQEVLMETQGSEQKGPQPQNCEATTPKVAEESAQGVPMTLEDGPVPNSLHSALGLTFLSLLYDYSDKGVAEALEIVNQARLKGELGFVGESAWIPVLVRSIQEMYARTLEDGLGGEGQGGQGDGMVLMEGESAYVKRGEHMAEVQRLEERVGALETQLSVLEAITKKVAVLEAKSTQSEPLPPSPRMMTPQVPPTPAPRRMSAPGTVGTAGANVGTLRAKSRTVA
jgi:hypothetical protein